MSPVVKKTGETPVGKSVGWPNPPDPSPRRTVIVLDSPLATARSSLPSPLRSLTAALEGLSPVG